MKKFLFFLIMITSIISAQKVEIKDAWIRPSAEGMNTGLFFLVINNSSVPDTLLSASSDLSEVVEVHETFKKAEDMMGMREVKFVAIPPKSTVRFKPRDLHVMLINLKTDMKIGTHGKVELNFKKSGKIKLNAIVRDMPKMDNSK